MLITNILEFEEGFRSKAYYCSENYPTIGIGTKLGPKGAPLEHYTFTVTRESAGMLLKDELRSIVDNLLTLSWYIDLNEERQAIIKSMCYQMGFSGVMKFKKMIKALENNKWDDAAKEALDSRWARQTPSRANRHAEVIRTGTLDAYEGLI